MLQINQVFKMLSQVYAIAVIILSINHVWCVDEEKIECRYNDFSTTEYNYNQSHSVTDVKNDNGIYLQFGVKADRDAHVIFTVSNQPAKKGDTAYEIVLGADKNRRYEIRRVRYGMSMNNRTENEANVLNSEEWRYFWIEITSDGNITIGKINDGTVLLSSKDEKLLAIGYYAFSSWENHNFVQWKFPCTKKTNDVTKLNSIITTTSTPPTLPKQTDEQKLIELLFQNHSVTHPTNHGNLDKANITISGHYSIKYDEFLEMNGSVSISWNNEKLKWNLTTYNVSELNNVGNHVWRPNITIKNNKTSDNKTTSLNSGTINLLHNGTVSWTAPWYINISCLPRGQSPYKPELRCSLNFTYIASNVTLHVDTYPKEGTPYLYNRALPDINEEKYYVELVYVRTRKPKHA